MSAGLFSRSSYLSTETGQVHPIRVQPETETLEIEGVGNVRPSAPISNPISARVSGSRRKLGLSARAVRIAWSGAAPAGYKAGGIISLPWLDGGTFGAIAQGQSGEYLGAAITVVGKTPEFLR